jgi:biotin transport system ATP-binding protein
LRPHTGTGGIAFEHVSRRFQDRLVLDSIDLNLREHRIGIIGANGSGKSTLARMINGLVAPTSGRVLIDGLDTAHDGRQIRRRVGFVFTNPDSQILMPTAGEDLAFTLRGRGLPKAEIAARVESSLERFGLKELADHPAHLLSGGQKQMLALASVLIGDPSVVVADEPTTLLDARNADRIRDVFAALAQQLVVVTHHLGLLEGFDRVILIEKGRVAADGEPVEAIAAYKRSWSYAR